MLDQETERRSWGQKARVSFFLVGQVVQTPVCFTDPVTGRLCDFGISAVRRA